MFICFDICRSLKQHVLEEVREARSPHAFVCRPNVVPEIHGYYRRRLVLGKCYEEPVIEAKLLYRYSHDRKLIGLSCQCNPVGARLELMVSV